MTAMHQIMRSLVPPVATGVCIVILYEGGADLTSIALAFLVAMATIVLSVGQ